MDVTVLASLCRLLGDQVRLRLLAVLDRHRLNVTELTAILGIAQSGVSRHLGLLKEAGLVLERRGGGFAYYEAADLGGDLAEVRRLLERAFDDGADVHGDEARLQEVLRLRKESFRDHGGEGQQLVPGRSWAAWARALGHLLPPLEVVDVGCGEGYLTIEVARWARRVVAIDASTEVLARARRLAERSGVRNVRWRRGRMERLPLADGSADVALLSQALHHAETPPQVVGEAVRVVRPGGRVLVLDLAPHDQAWVEERLGDRWRGFDQGVLSAWLREGGLTDVRVEVGARAKGDPFVVVIASGIRPRRRPRAASGARSNGARRRGSTA